MIRGIATLYAIVNLHILIDILPYGYIVVCDSIMLHCLKNS
jgi:hypothetical protein